MSDEHAVRDAWDAMSAGMAMLLSRLSDEQVGAVRDTFVDAVLERYGPTVTELLGTASSGWVVGSLAHRPPAPCYRPSP